MYPFSTVFAMSSQYYYRNHNLFTATVTTERACTKTEITVLSDFWTTVLLFLFFLQSPLGNHMSVMVEIKSSD